MISVTILTKNSSATLLATLESVKSFDEVIIYDTGSSDNTIDIAQAFPNVKIYAKQLIGFGPSHNEASSLASHDWILSLDSDETVSSALTKEIQGLKLDLNAIYEIQRENYFEQKHIRYCSGWHPDYVIRLYNRKTTSFSSDAVHEKILSQGLKTIRLKNVFNHVPYRTTHDFISKMQLYSTLFAEQNRYKKRSSLKHAILHGFFAFFKSYLLKKGFLAGRQGFIISLYNAHVTYYKYLKLAELNRS